MLAGVVATTLGLAACGSDDDGDGEDTTAASTSPSSASAESSASSESSEPESSAPESSEETDQDSEDTDTDVDADADAEADADPQADGDGEPAEQNGDDDNPGAQPAAARSVAAPEDDAGQIRGVSEGLAGDRKYADYLQYVYDTTCTANIDQQGGRESYQEEIDRAREEDTMWSEVAGGVENIPTVHGVNDIAVEGDRATANVDRTMKGNRATEPVVYVREDGAWKTCAGA